MHRGGGFVVSAGWGSLLGQLLAPAMVVAMSPLSIIAAVVLVLHTDRPGRNGVAFLTGRLIGLAANAAAGVSDRHRRSGPGGRASRSRLPLRRGELDGRRSGPRLRGSRCARRRPPDAAQRVAAPAQWAASAASSSSWSRSSCSTQEFADSKPQERQSSVTTEGQQDGHRHHKLGNGVQPVTGIDL